ncbi:hypothetical protein FQR65_LT18560 [Abscondita terminalis]|nr:hypothetical protein FQR65_LT18560 [Abscondita terminalis]
MLRTEKHTKELKEDDGVFGFASTSTASQQAAPQVRTEIVKIIKRRELKLLHPILDTRRKTRGFASEFGYQKEDERFCIRVWIPEGRFGLRHRTRRGRFGELVVCSLV